MTDENEVLGATRFVHQETTYVKCPRKALLPLQSGTAAGVCGTVA